MKRTLFLLLGCFFIGANAVPMTPTYIYHSTKKTTPTPSDTAPAFAEPASGSIEIESSSDEVREGEPRAIIDWWGPYCITPASSFSGLCRRCGIEEENTDAFNPGYCAECDSHERNKHIVECLWGEAAWYREKKAKAQELGGIFTIVSVKGGFDAVVKSRDGKVLIPLDPDAE